MTSAAVYIDGHRQTVWVDPTASRGIVAEAIAAQWLIDQGWTILHHRWHCRWGEIDLIAHPQGCSPQPPQTSRAQFNQIPSNRPMPLVFVEVKARSRGNWDANGLLSITPAKQAKLWTAAELFLSEHPQWAASPCRFDVILMRQGRSPQSSSDADVSEKISVPRPVQFGTWARVGASAFCLDRHLPHAFESD